MSEPTIDPIMLARVISSLRKAIIDPKKPHVSDFIKWSIKHAVTEDGLRGSIEHDLDIVTLALNHFGIGHSSVSPLFRTALRLSWDEVEEYILNPRNLLETLRDKPDCFKMLNTPRGIDYLNRCCESAYRDLYEFAWG